MCCKCSICSKYGKHLWHLSICCICRTCCICCKCCMCYMCFKCCMYLCSLFSQNSPLSGLSASFGVGCVLIGAGGAAFCHVPFIKEWGYGWKFTTVRRGVWSSPRKFCENMTSFGGNFGIQLSIFDLFSLFTGNGWIFLWSDKKVDGTSELSSWRYRRAPLLPDNPAFMFPLCAQFAPYTFTWSKCFKCCKCSICSLYLYLIKVPGVKVNQMKKKKTGDL